MQSPIELLKELNRLNKSGVINDEEFLVLRKIVSSGGKISQDVYRRFDKLFAGDSKSNPVESFNKKKRAEIEAKPSDKKERLYSFDEALNELNLKLTSIGGFDNSRELLSCPACGMFESVTPEGRLITAEPIDPKADTGLRFVKVNNEEWECPDCGHLCRETLIK